MIKQFVLYYQQVQNNIKSTFLLETSVGYVGVHVATAVCYFLEQLTGSKHGEAVDTKNHM